MPASAHKKGLTLAMLDYGGIDPKKLYRPRHEAHSLYAPRSLQPVNGEAAGKRMWIDAAGQRGRQDDRCPDN